MNIFIHENFLIYGISSKADFTLLIYNYMIAILMNKLIKVVKFNNNDKPCSYLYTDSNAVI